MRTLFTKSSGLTGFLSIACLLIGGAVNTAMAQDLLVQVELSLEGNNGCSILRVTPSGVLSEFVSNADILAVSGETSCDVDDTGMAIAPNGTLYFNEDVSDQIYQVTPAGVVSVFVDKATLDAAVGTSNDIDNGMTFGSDGNLYAADEDCDCIIQITVPGGVVSVVVPKANILAATTFPNADLEGGLARAADGRLFFVDDGNSESVLESTPAGVVSVLASESAVTTATGDSSIDLDVGIVLAGNNLYVLDDGSDTLFRVDINSGAVSLIASAATLAAAAGVTGVDLEGGIALNPTTGNLFIGDDGFDETFQDFANILEVTPAGSASLFVSDAQITAFYEPIYGTGADFRLRGSMVFQSITPTGTSTRATFRVTKFFADGNDVAEVTVSIDCNTGLILDQDKLLSDNEWVEFVVTDYTDGTLTCTITEDGETGYSGEYHNITLNITNNESCVYTDIGGSDTAFECQITNSPDPVTVDIYKDWVFQGATAPDIDTYIKIVLVCDSEILKDVDCTILGPASDSPPVLLASVNYSAVCEGTTGLNDVGMVAQVIPKFPKTNCEVFETVFDQAIEVDNGCGSFTVEADQGHSCIITNTVFFEGIPTLSQYGMALLALLMLGVGMVSFRRIS